MTDHAPFYFGGAQHLFGWFAPGSSFTRRDCAVLVCPPLGHEYMCGYRALRHLSMRLADAGFPVLRFDHFGTGNSAGGPEDPSLVPAWHQGVSLAIDELRRLSGVERIVVVGLRFGATIATAVAADRGDVDTLVLWSPCISGKSYVRQVRMLGLTNTERAEGQDSSPGRVEAAGFQFSAETASALSAMNMLQLATRPARRALLFTRDDVPLGNALAEHLTEIGTECEERHFAGYARFMVSPIHSELPYAAIEQLAAWLEREYPALSPAQEATGPAAIARALPASGPARVPGTRICEEPVSFGESLAGIFTTPLVRPTPDTPAVLFLNTGADHHVGPHRLYARFSRDWAALGFPVLRFDIGGVGDSPERPGTRENDAYPRTALEDVATAVAYLRDVRGFGRVVLVGMCSGAYHAVHGCTLPVAGVIAINPPLYWEPGSPVTTDFYTMERDAESEAQRISQSVFMLAKWRRLITGQVDLRSTGRVLAVRARGSARAASATVRHLIGLRGRAASRRLVDLLSKQVPMELIFSEGDPALTYVQQTLGPAMTALFSNGYARMEVVPGAGHTFMPVDWHERLAAILTGKLTSLFGSPAQNAGETQRRTPTATRLAART
jgi:pimeloyl-ACP methyl ester carboxylesterase